AASSTDLGRASVSLRGPEGTSTAAACSRGAASCQRQLRGRRANTAGAGRVWLAPGHEGLRMLLALTLIQPPATDLGYLLGKSPARAQSFPLAFGQAHVFYPEATAQRCTAALLLDIDPVGLVRDRRGPA